MTVDQVRGMDIDCHSISPTDEEAKELLSLMGMPLQQGEIKLKEGRAKGSSFHSKKKAV